MGRLLALGILGALASASLVQPSLARTLASFGGTSSQAGSITGTVSTAVKGVAPVRVTIDQKVCGDELPDEAIIVDAQGRLANAVVILSGVKRAAAADATVMNEKCRFTPRVQLIAPKASVTTTSRDAVLHTTNAQLENGRSLFNVALPIPGITITKPISSAGKPAITCVRMGIAALRSTCTHITRRSGKPLACAIVM